MAEKPNDAATSPGEHTLAGTIIGKVHDAFSNRPQDAQSLAQRAQSHDQIAEIAADTLSMLPGMKVWAAGAIRSIALIDPKASLADNALGGGINFVEGVGLNLVMRGGSRVGGYLTPKIGSRLLAEGIGHATFGSGMGVIKAGFNGQTWKNESGQLDFGHATGEITKAGLVGGVINIPAGFAGSWLGKKAFTAAEQGVFSNRTASVLSGTGGGYAGGAIFGGVDAAMHGGGWQQILRGAHDGGIIGAVTGGATGAVMRVEPLGVPSIKRAQTLPIDQVELMAMDRMSKGMNGRKGSAFADSEAVTDSPDTPYDTEEFGGFQKTRRRTRPRKGEEGDIKKIDEPEPTEFWRPRNWRESLAPEIYQQLGIKHKPEGPLETRLNQVRRYSHVMREVEVINPNAKAILDTYTEFTQATFSDFYKQAVTRTPKLHRVYKSGQHEILIEESYAARLDEVARLRREAAKDQDAAGITEQQKQSILIARAQLEKHPLGDRAHPADIIGFMKEVPDGTLVSRYVLEEHPYALDIWSQKTYQPDSQANATALASEKTITFYGLNRRIWNRETNNHEWGHLLKSAAQTESKLYDLGAELESNGYVVSDYSKRQYPEHPEWKYEESFAEHIKFLLHNDTDTFLTTAHEAPVRTVVAARALINALAFAPANGRSVIAPEIGSRLAYINTEVLPEAQRFLSWKLKHGTASERNNAAELLVFFGDQPHLEMMMKVAASGKKNVDSESIFRSAWQMVFRGKETILGYNESKYTDTVDQQTDFLVEMARPDSAVSELAIRFLVDVPGERAQAYHDLLTIDRAYRNTSDKVVKLLELMHSNPDLQGKEMTWAKALSLYSGDPNQRVNLALSVIAKERELIGQAVGIIAQEAQPRTRPLLDYFANLEAPPRRAFGRYSAGEIKQIAQQGLDAINANETFSKNFSAYENSQGEARVKAIEALGKAKDSRAIRVLLHSYAHGSPAEQAAALTALSAENFAPNMTHYVMREMMEADPMLTLSFRPLLTRKP